MAYRVPETVLPSRAICGECPIWVKEEQALYWIDIYGKALNRFDPGSGTNQRWALPEEIGSFALRRRGGFLCAMRSGLALVELEPLRLRYIARPELGLVDNRLNDGRCDPVGRFWVGSMQEGQEVPAGSLYRLDADLSVTRVFGGVMCSNGLAFSPDGRRMYWSDSRRSTIYRFSYDIDSGDIYGREVFARPPAKFGRPDGAAMDCDGCYWSAGYAGGKIVRYAPDGRIDRVIDIPTPNVTMCAFGGRDLKTLYITSARLGMDKKALVRSPEAGNLFAMELDVPGLPEARFSG